MVIKDNSTYFKDKIIIFKYNCAPNSLRFGKVVAEKQLNEYMVLSDFDFSRFCHGGGGGSRKKSLGSGKHKCHIVKQIFLFGKMSTKPRVWRGQGRLFLYQVHQSIS